MASKRVLSYKILLALLFLAALRQAGGEAAEDSTPTVSERQKLESKLTVGKAILSGDGIIRFPLHFTAAPGETVGAIRAQVTIPERGWKFRKIVPAAGSNLKASAQRG